LLRLEGKKGEKKGENPANRQTSKKKETPSIIDNVEKEKTSNRKRR